MRRALSGVMIAVARKYDSEYESSVERVTISIDKQTLNWIKQVAGRRGVSKFLAEAARKQLWRARVIKLLDELDEKYGKPTKAEKDAIYADMRKIFGYER
jgi:hypothetical protein